MREFWQGWMRHEDAYVEREHPVQHADIIVDGAPTIGYDADRDYVELSRP
jgi:hypothetical protein